MMLAPLAADMYYIVSHVGEKHSVLVGTGGAFAQAYGLLNTALALGTITGPALAGLIYDREGWYKAMWAMAAFCASGVVPVVRAIRSLKDCHSSRETDYTFPDPLHWKEIEMLNTVHPKCDRGSRRFLLLDLDCNKGRTSHTV